MQKQQHAVQLMNMFFNGVEHARFDIIKRIALDHPGRSAGREHRRNQLNLFLFKDVADQHLVDHLLILDRQIIIRKGILHRDMSIGFSPHARR